MFGSADPLLPLLLLAGLLATACAPSSLWRATATTRSQDLPVLLESSDPSEMSRHIFGDEIPEIPIRKRLRPCCAFGSELRAKLGPIPIPFYSISNVLDVSDIGPHSYDSGVLLVRYGDAPEVLLNAERNGLVYTCRGGFIDTAHVRDYTDWAMYIATQLGANLETGVTIELGEEGGMRRIVATPVDEATIERLGRPRIAVALAHWLAFEMSVYHEIVTWFGWAAVPGFSERASAFSPEDAYSNLLGVKVASAIIYKRFGRTERQYNGSVGVWLAKVLKYLEAVPRDVGREAAQAVDGLWWDSRTRLPDARLVLRRDFQYGPQVTPWRVPEARMTPALREACGGREPVVLSNPDTVEDLVLPEIARLEIDVPPAWTGNEPWKSLGPRVSQADFPAIIAFVREQALEEFGPGSDRPD